ARAYAEIEGVDLFVCDTDAGRIEQARRELRLAGSFSSVADVLASQSVDALDISLPHSMHAPVAVDAATHKKHCMIEKPLATSLAEAGRMREGAQGGGTIVAVGEHFLC